jgi:hypothetical protein
MSHVRLTSLIFSSNNLWSQLRFSVCAKVWAMSCVQIITFGFGLQCRQPTSSTEPYTIYKSLPTAALMTGASLCWREISKECYHLRKSSLLIRSQKYSLLPPPNVEMKRVLKASLNYMLCVLCFHFRFVLGQANEGLWQTCFHLTSMSERASSGEHGHNHLQTPIFSCFFMKLSTENNFLTTKRLFQDHLFWTVPTNRVRV